MKNATNVEITASLSAFLIIKEMNTRMLECWQEKLFVLQV